MSQSAYKKLLQTKMIELTVDDLKLMMVKALNGSMAISGRKRRTVVRIIKQQLEARKKAEQTLMGEEVTGYTSTNSYNPQPTTRDYLGTYG